MSIERKPPAIADMTANAPLFNAQFSPRVMPMRIADAMMRDSDMMVAHISRVSSFMKLSFSCTMDMASWSGTHPLGVGYGPCPISSSVISLYIWSLGIAGAVYNAVYLPTQSVKAADLRLAKLASCAVQYATAPDASA